MFEKPHLVHDACIFTPHITHRHVMDEHERIQTGTHACSWSMQGRSLTCVGWQGPWRLYNELPALRVYLSHFLIKLIQLGPACSVSVYRSDVLSNISLGSRLPNRSNSIRQSYSQLFTLSVWEYSIKRIFLKERNDRLKRTRIKLEMYFSWDFGNF